MLEFCASGRPLLGICVGMQMLTLGSEEGTQPGLGLIRLIRASLRRVPVWASRIWGGTSSGGMIPDHPLARELTAENRFYFVHSYCVTCESAANSLAECTYGEDFSAAIVAGNLAGVQFHPEKSHRFGLQLLRNFAAS